MANPRKGPSPLTSQDLSVKRLIEFHPVTVADIAHILQLTTQKVRASLEKLEHNNQVYHLTHKDEHGRRNYYHPTQIIEPGEVKYSRYVLKQGIATGLAEAETVEDKAALMQALDKHFKIVYNGLAGLANSRKAVE